MGNGCVPLLSIDVLGTEIEVQPEQEIHIDGLAIRRDLAHEIHSAVIPRLSHTNKLLDSILSLEPESVRHATLKA